MSDAIHDLHGERLVLLAERAAYWEREHTLLVADPHFGKAAAFRAAGVPVPRGTTTETLARLDAALVRTAARRVVFLGDFLHAREGRAPETLRVVNDWRASRASIEMLLVRGNHDKRAGDPPVELNVRCIDGPMIEPPFAFAHHPARSDNGYVIGGHVHPGVRLTGPGREHTRLACFWFGAEIAVLPAFGEFTGLADVDVAPGDRVWVIADRAVVEISARSPSPRGGGNRAPR
jgi:uncharacterized protein